MIPFSPFNVGYAGAGGSLLSQTLAGFNSWSSTATNDILPVRMWLVSRARQLAISNPLAAASIDRMTGGIVGDGLTYVVTEDEFSKELSKQWKLASYLKLLDSQHRQTFLQIQDLACRNWLLSGDVFFVRNEGKVSSWRAVESDRVQSPYYFADRSVDYCSPVCINPDNGYRIVDGVELDDNSTPCAYWILRDYISQPLIVTPDQIERIPAYDNLGMPLVLHLFSPKRPDQYRGVPLLAETIESLHATTGFIRSVEQAAQFQSSVWGFVTSENPTMDETEPLYSRDLDEKIPVAPKPDNAPENTPTMTLSTDIPTDYDLRAMTNKMYPKPKTISAGELWSLKAGEDVKFLSPTNPNPQFGEYIKAQTGMIASAIGIPLQVLSCNYDGTYASARGSVLEANRQFKRYRGFFIEQFLKPVFEQFIFDITGDINTAVEYSVLSQWQAPTALCLDPTKEIDAWTKAIQLGLCDRDEAAMALYGHKATGTPQQPDRTVEVEEI